MSESSRYFRIDGKDLVYLKFVLEAYEGLATLSTVDARNGIIRINTPCCQRDDLGALLQALAKELPLCELSSPQAVVAGENLLPVREHCHA